MVSGENSLVNRPFLLPEFSRQNETIPVLAYVREELLPLMTLQFFVYKGDVSNFSRCFQVP